MSAPPLENSSQDSANSRSRKILRSAFLVFVFLAATNIALFLSIHFGPILILPTLRDAPPHLLMASSSTAALTEPPALDVAPFYSTSVSSAATSSSPWDWVPISLATDSPYSQKDTTIYFDDNPIPSADPRTFLIAQDSTPHDYSWSNTGPDTYAKDKGHVYWGHTAGIDAEPVAAGADPITADPTTFAPIYDNNGYFTGYAKDARSVFFGEIVLYPGIDTVSFDVLPSGEPPDGYVAFSKDKNHVYTLEGVVQKADPATFEYIGGYPKPGINNGPIYGKDENHVYESSLQVPAFVIPNANPMTFIIATSSN